MDPTSCDILPDKTYLVISHEEAERRAKMFCKQVLSDETLIATIQDIGFSFCACKHRGYVQTALNFSALLSKEGEKLRMERHNKVLRNLYDIVWITNYVYDLALLKYERDKGR